MMYQYLSLPLAVGLSIFNTTSGLSATAIELDLVAVQSDREYSKVSLTTSQLPEPTYLGLMNAGYNAHQEQDHVTAVGYFRQALSLQPGDTKAQQAIQTVGTYGFDLAMQAGYAADRVRDYGNALGYFQKALQIRPDSWYAQEAVKNVNSYIAQQPVTTPPTSQNNSNPWFMLILMGGITAFSLGLIFYLFKKGAESLPEESSPEIPSQTATESEPTLPVTPPPVINKTTETPKAVEAAAPQTSTTTIVSRQNSLTKLDIVPELIGDLDKSDRSIRRKAVWELAQRGDSRAMKPLVELMMEVDSQERGLILEAMTQIAGRTLKPMNKAIMLSLQDDNSQVKQNAIRDLTRVYELMSQVTKRLSLAVEDSDAKVQETAKWALQKLNQMPANTAAWNVTEEATPPDSTRYNGSSRNGNGTNRPSHTVEQQYPFN